MKKQTLPKLRVNKKEAKNKIQARIEKGELFSDREICSEEELDIVRMEAENWSKYNTDLLIKLFDNPSVSNDYKGIYRRGSLGYAARMGLSAIPDLEDKIREYQKDMADSIISLRGISDRLELFGEVLDNASQTFDNKGISDNPTRTFGDEVFIVHGHDEAAKQSIARFVEKFNLKAIILDEQVSKGQTIIDKFEEYADKAGFAIVLLTPDDIGAPKDKQGGLKDRARQNVILELGYFLHKLGRKRVRVLHKKEVELPSDIHGIVYVPMNNPNDWQLKLAKEMKQVGLPVDLNKLAEK